MVEVRQPPADFLARAESEPVPHGQVALWYTGGAGYIYRTPTTTLQIDPFCGKSIDANWSRLIAPPFDPARVTRCDAILSTHEHLDHCDPETLKAMAGVTTCPLIGPASSTDVAREFGWPAARLAPLAWGERTIVGDVTITAIQSNDPMAKGCNGYVLEAQGLVVVNMGDSLWYNDIGKQLAPWSVDAICVSVAQNPPGETYYMSEVDAARIARDVNARALIPHHWDLWRWVALDPRRIAAVAPWYAPATVVCPARYCERISLIRAGSDGLAVV